MFSSIHLNFWHEEVRVVPYNYNKLLGRIVEKFGTQSRFADAMELSERTVSLKLNGRIGWKQTEIAKACEVLDIDIQDICQYFFAL